MSLFDHTPHPHVKRRQTAGPVKVGDQQSSGINSRIALRLCAWVGTMPTAYVFAFLAFLALPGVLGWNLLPNRTLLIVAWLSQTLIQLVMLAVLQLGQNLQARAADARSEQTWHDASATLHECLELQRHLQAQDQELARLLDVHAMVTDLHARHGGGAENTHD